MTTANGDPSTPDEPTSSFAHSRKLALGSMRKSVASRQNKPLSLPRALCGLGLLGATAILATRCSGGEPPTASSIDTHIDEAPVPKVRSSDSARSSTSLPRDASEAPDSPDQDAIRQRELETQVLAKQAVEAERMRQARLKSAITPDGNDAGDELPSATGETTVPTLRGAGELTHERQRGQQDPNSEFARSVAGGNGNVAKAIRIGHLGCKILQGKILDAKLMPRTSSDLPGTLTAMIDRDVYGEQGRNVLLPWGTRLVGTPNTSVRKGQERVFIAWTRAIRPDGITVNLDSYAADQLGTAGLAGNVEHHAFQILGMSVLLSLLGAGSSTIGVTPSDQMNSIALYRQNVQSSLAQSSQQLLQGYASIPPTITVPNGSRLRVLVNRDLDLTDSCPQSSEE